MNDKQQLAEEIRRKLTKPTDSGRYAETGYNDHFNDGVDELFDALEEAGLFEGPSVEQFVRWADRSKAITWTGKLGIKERWLNRDNAEYQIMLQKRGEKRNAV